MTKVVTTSTQLGVYTMRLVAPTNRIVLTPIKTSTGDSLMTSTGDSRDTVLSDDTELVYTSSRMDSIRDHIGACGTDTLGKGISSYNNWS